MLRAKKIDEIKTIKEAKEFFNFNIGGGWYGKETPMWVRPCGIDDLEGEEVWN